MNNELPELINDLLRRRWVRLTLVVVVLILIVWTVLYISLQPAKMTATPLGITTDSTIQTAGDTINVYNGTSFYTIDTANNNAVKVIFTPNYRLPEILSMSWADDKGALLNFTGSGLTHTPVFDYLFEHDIDYYDGDYYTWYLDFSTGELSLVGDFNLVGDTAHYSAKDDGYYFVPDIQFSGTRDTINQLWFYSLESGESSVVVSSFNNDVSSITSCDYQGNTVCIVARKTSEAYGDAYLYATSVSNKKLTTVYKQQGDIYPTPLSDTFVLLGEAEEYNDVSVIYKKISTLNISSNKTVDYSGSVFANSAVVGIDNGSLYIVDGETSEIVWLKSNVIVGDSQVNSVDSEDLEDGMMLMSNQSGNNVIVASMTGDIYLLSSKNSASPTKDSTESAAALIGGCTNKYNGSFSSDSSKYTIFIKDDESSFVSNIAEIKKCIAQHPSLMVGYTYEYRGVSGVNGRISTD